MREIKFRGRYSPDHDWVYGDYYKYYDGSFMHVITYIDDNLMQNTLCPIDIDSLGQFTGLKDKHGVVDIYEGDIVSLEGTKIGNKYENEDLLKEKTNLLIEGMGTAAWHHTEQEARERGCKYAK